MGTMDVICTEKKMIDIDEPLVVGDHCKPSRPSSPPTELEPCEEFPILYGLLTAPKSFKPKNSGELHHLPQDLNSDYSNGLVVVVNRAQVMMQCPSPDAEEISMEEADSQNLDFCRGSPASSSSPQSADSSSSNMSSPDENDSPIFLNYLSGRNSANNHCGNSNGQEFSEDELSIIGSPGGSSVGDDCLDDDNIPTSTTSGFKRKACRLETAIGNIVRRRRVYKRPGPNNNNNPSSVPISMAPSSPTVSTTCVDPPPPPPPSQNSRGRSEILERILRSSTVHNPIASQQPQQNGRANGPRNNNDRGRSSDSNNNECNGYEPYAKLRDLLTMSEDQLVKRRRLEYGHGLTNNNQNNNNSSNDNKTGGGGHEPARRREFSPPRNNILASLLQKGRAHELPPRGGRHSFENNGNGVIRNPPALVAINNLKRSDNNNINNNSVNDERPYKCSLCDLRFKKLPLLNRHVKTHSHIKRYVCRFCSHAFKRSDNLLAHMRTSCKGIKESDAKFAGGVRPSSGQILPSLLSSSSSQGLGQALASPSLVSRSQLEEALLNLRDQAERLCSTQQHSSSDSQLVSTTTASPPLRTQSIQPGPDFQSRHSKLLEILSGSPVSANQLVVQDDDDEDDEEEQEDMPLPLSLKVDSRSSSPPSSLSPSSSSQSQFLRSHHRLYSNLVKQNELPEGEGQEEEEGEEENDNEQPLNLGSSRSLPAASPPLPATVPSARSRDHPEIVSILSRQPKNVVMMIPELRKLVGLDSL